MAGPLALAQLGEHGTGLAFAHALAVAGREQVLAAVPAGQLTVTVLSQQRADLVSQRQRMLDAGLGVFSRDVPRTLGQAEVCPLRHARLADAGAVAQHQ
ncbi:hypothetical protein D3C77_550410 [compost metagenome]